MFVTNSRFALWIPGALLAFGGGLGLFGAITPSPRMPAPPPLVAAAAIQAPGVVPGITPLPLSEPLRQSQIAAPIDTAILNRYSWRSIGPDRGGRSIAVSGVRGRPSEAYFGATGGGLWKTTDGGENWAPVTDGQIRSSSVGAVAVSESNPDIVFIGMGETCIRGNIQPGDGVYKSSDAGKSWTHIGFSESDAIAKIRIHPTNPNIVYVASFGKYGAPSEERGVFKSTDGGRTWKRTLFRDAKTGAVDISIDPNNPNVIYAAMWEAFRVEYSMSSGGPGSGLFKSTDGGETWREITRNRGMPSGLIGKIGVSVSGANSNRVYALVENDNGGLFRSDDAGATWELVNSNRNIRQRAFYYTHVAADPKNADLVYLLNVSAYRSTDGGRTLSGLGGGTHGDHHDFWIDPDNPQHVVIGNDGGGAVSMTGGVAAGGAGAGRGGGGGGGVWTPQDFPTPQYYHVVTTTHQPFHLCGAQQDGSTVCVPSSYQPASAEFLTGAGINVGGRAGGAGGGGGGGRGGGRGGRAGGAAAADALYSPGGSEPAYIAPDPKDSDVFFSGGNNGSFLIYTNRRTGQRREVNPYPRMFSGEPSSALVERWQWTYPIIFSPVDPNVLYTSSQHVWKTTNNGLDWEKISPDLTRHDPKTMGHSGGPITGDMNGPEVYAVVFALAPSKRDVNVIWAGSDDGLIHVTRDGGRNWSNVTPRDMPEFGRVSIIDASAFDAGTAYAAVKKPLLGDKSPYIFRTTDYGQTWTKVVNGLGPSDYVHTVRADHKRRGLLYAGTQHGVYISYNDGANWQSLSRNLPDVQISDLIVEENALAISTHGRGFYVLDDINLLRHWTPAMSQAADVVLLTPADAIRSAPGGGANITYWVKRPLDTLTIEIIDPSNQVVRTFTGGAAAGGAPGGGGRAGAGGGGGGRGGGRGGGGGAAAATAPGFQTVSWNLQYDGAVTFPGMILWGASTAGPVAAPGTYQVRLTAAGRTQTQPLIVRRNPLYRDVSDADLKAQFDLAIRIRDKVSEANNAVIRLRDIKTQVTDRLGKSQDRRLRTAADTLTKRLSVIEEEIYQVRNQSGQDPLNFPIKINNRLASLSRVVNTGDSRPIGNAPAIFSDLVAELKVQTDRLAQIIERDLAAVNAELRRLNLEAIR